MTRSSPHPYLPWPGPNSIFPAKQNWPSLFCFVYWIPFAKKDALLNFTALSNGTLERHHPTGTPLHSPHAAVTFRNENTQHQKYTEKQDRTQCSSSFSLVVLSCSTFQQQKAPAIPSLWILDWATSYPKDDRIDRNHLLPFKLLDFWSMLGEKSRKQQLFFARSGGILNFWEELKF